MTIKEFFNLCNHTIDPYNCNILIADGSGRYDKVTCIDVCNYENKKIIKFYPYIEPAFGTDEIHVDFWVDDETVGVNK